MRLQVPQWKNSFVDHEGGVGLRPFGRGKNIAENITQQPIATATNRVTSRSEQNGAARRVCDTTAARSSATTIGTSCSDGSGEEVSLVHEVGGGESATEHGLDDCDSASTSELPSSCELPQVGLRLPDASPQGALNLV
jgi:hypothetical protein